VIETRNKQVSLTSEASKQTRYIVHFTGRGFTAPDERNPNGVRVVGRGQIIVDGLRPSRSFDIPFEVIERATYHYNRVAYYKKNLAALKSMDVASTSTRPGQEAESKIQAHEVQEAEMLFISNHLVLGETYQLDAGDLQKLGIAGRSW
jgi:hypothetical protein